MARNSGIKDGILTIEPYESDYEKYKSLYSKESIFQAPSYRELLKSMSIELLTKQEDAYYENVKAAFLKCEFQFITDLEFRDFLKKRVLIINTPDHVKHFHVDEILFFSIKQSEQMIHGLHSYTWLVDHVVVYSGNKAFDV